MARSKVAAKALISSTHWVDLPEECDEVPVHGDAVDHPVGERDPAYLDVVATTNGVFDGDVLKPLVTKPETSRSIIFTFSLQIYISTREVCR